MKRNVLFILFTLLMTLLAAGIALAQTDPRPVTDDEVNAIAKKLYCPVCENIPLDVCGTQACEQWRDEIRIRLARGESEEQIVQYFIDNFGIRVVPLPPNPLIYIVPALAILAGVFILFRAFKTWRQPAARPASPPGEAASASTDPYVARLEEELRRR